MKASIICKNCNHLIFTNIDIESENQLIKHDRCGAVRVYTPSRIREGIEQHKKIWEK